MFFRNCVNFDSIVIECNANTIALLLLIKFTGKKFTNKKYYRHSGHPGGLKTTTPLILMKKKPEEILKLAVRRMLPSGPLAKKQLTKLKIYKGASHPHESQNPKIIDFAKINSKNCISIN